VPDRIATEKFQILREIFDLARAQRAYLEEDRLDLVLMLMDQRDALMVRLERVITELSEVPDNVIAFPSPASGDWSHQDQLALDTLIRGIMEHDEQNEQMLAEKMDAVRAELPRLQHGRRAHSGYRSPDVGGHYVDRVS
jgi:hypothetical protein